MDEYFLVAKIVSVSGKEGYVKVISYSDFPERFLKLKKVFIDFFGDRKEFFVESVKNQGKSVLLKFKNFDNEKDVSVLIGKEVFVDNENLVKLPDDHYFVHDLIGSIVIRNGKTFGVITDVLSYPANDVYVIKNVNDEEILIPAVKEFISEFDSKNKVLTLTPGDELYDDDEN